MCIRDRTSIGDIRNLGSDMRDRRDYGEKTELTIAASKVATTKTAWAVVPDLQIYEKPIWEYNASHWLTPMEEFCQSCTELTFEFVDSTGERFYDLHPSARQHMLWLKQELQDKLNLSEKMFDSANMITEFIETQHKKYRTNRYAFDFSIANKEKFPPEANKLTWPGTPQGF